MKEKFNVTGMTCSACSAHVEKAVKKLDGVLDVAVNLLQNEMTVTYNEEKLSSADIVKAVEEAGYGASSLTTEKKERAPQNPMREEIEGLRRRLIVSVVFLIPLMYVSMGHMYGFPFLEAFHGTQNAMTFVLTQFLMALPIVYVNRKFFTVGFRSLWNRAPNMDSLIAIGASAAILYGIVAMYAIGYGLGHGDIELVKRFMMDLYFESAATILTLITVGKFLEARSKGRTSDAIAKLLDLSPKTAIVLRNEEEVEIPSEDVVVGDVVIVRSGGSVPVDGVVLDGNASIDESALTGESLPVEKWPGDKVIGATINRSGFFRFRATQVGNDTTISKIIELVRDASGSKAPIAKLADKVSGIFVPVVIAIALMAAAVWLLLGCPISFALSIGIAVLVISCPCALGLATPTAIMVGTGRGAEFGVLFKSAESLETTHSVNAVVMDKTGTITEGKPAVTDIVPFNGMDAQAILTLAASLETMSEHPLAKAVVEKAKEGGLTLFSAENFEAVPGRGIKGTVDGKIIHAGNRRMMEDLGLSVSESAVQAESLAEEGKTPLYISDGERLLGMLALADTIKSTSARAVSALQTMGIEVTMLTGDNRRTAEAIQKMVNADRVVSEVLPQDKEEEVRRIQGQGKKVAMVGDGINDAPALARADVGIAIGAGTDIAIESADVVLMKSDLMDAVTAVQLSKAVIRNIKQNLFWAFFYNAVGIPLAAGVFYPVFGWKLNPMFAAAAMSLSSFCVVTNALRLKFFKPASGDAVENEKPKTGEIDVAERINTIHKEDENVKKVMTIEGMSCGHCSSRVEKVLNGIPGVEARVDLEAKSAFIDAGADVSDDVLKKAVEDAGYDVTSIQNRGS